MNKQIITIMIGMFLISCVSAINITAGETYELELGEVPSYYIITNTTFIDVNITYNGTIALITPNKYLQNDTFTITFYNSKDELITIVGSSGGGGCLTTWGNCSLWSECINRTQTRECSKVLDYCYAYPKDKPITEQECDIIDDNTIDVSDDDIVISQPTEDKGFFLWRFFRWLLSKLGFGVNYYGR